MHPAPDSKHSPRSKLWNWALPADDLWRDLHYRRLWLERVRNLPVYVGGGLVMALVSHQWVRLTRGFATPAPEHSCPENR